MCFSNIFVNCRDLIIKCQILLQSKHNFFMIDEFQIIILRLT